MQKKTFSANTLKVLLSSVSLLAPSVVITTVLTMRARRLCATNYSLSVLLYYHKLKSMSIDLPSICLNAQNTIHKLCNMQYIPERKQDRSFFTQLSLLIGLDGRLPSLRRGQRARPSLQIPTKHQQNLRLRFPPF